MNALIDLKIPLESDLMTTVRLLTGGVCSLVGLGLEESEDCKVCVTESLLLLKHGGCRAAHLTFVREGGIRVTIEGEGLVALPGLGAGMPDAAALDGDASLLDVALPDLPHGTHGAAFQNDTSS